MKECLYYSQGEKSTVICHTCPHNCKIKLGNRGICQVRENTDGKLVLSVYGDVIASSMDPIEKKPLFNFFPGRETLSIATCGCNLKCTHCQNYSISQSIDSRQGFLQNQIEPEKLIANCLDNNCHIISPFMPNYICLATIFIQFPFS